MKRLTSFLILALTVLLIVQSKAQSIQNRTESSDLVIEGKVIQTESYWNTKRTQILTSNVIEVYKIFKGEWTEDKIEVITKGGVTEDAFSHVFHSLHLRNGMEGIFFCKQSAKAGKKLNKPAFEIHLEEAGFIQIFDDKLNPAAADYRNKFENITEEIVEEIELASLQPTLVLKEFPTKIKQETITPNNPENTETEISIEYTFENPQVILPNTIEFDIYAKVNQIGSGVKFGESEIYIEYNTEVFGQSVFTNGVVQLTKGNIIQSSIYQLTVADENQETLKIGITGGCENLLDAFTLSTTGQQLAHIELTIQDFTQIANIEFDEFLMSGHSKYLPSKGGGCLDFDTILVDNPLNLNGDAGITYEFGNFGVTGTGSNRSLEFDILVASDVENTDFYQGVILVDYSPTAFGGNAATSGNLTVSNGTLLQNNNYSVNVSNESFNVFRIEIIGNDENNLEKLPKDLTQIVRVRLRGDNCGATADILFDQDEMVGQQLYYEDDIIPFVEYDPVIANDTYNQVACSETHPIIFGFEPSIVSAGIEDKVFIKGLNFDDFTQGKVKFQDANHTIEIYQDVFEVDILDWTDTLIEVRVPSEMEDFGVAGTGKVGMEKFNGLSALSDDILTVEYAVSNTIFDIDGEPYRVNLIAQDDEDGYTFLIDSFLFNQPHVVDCIDKALLAWSCETGVTWKIGGVTDISIDEIDGKNVIFWSGSLPDSLLMVTSTSGNRVLNCENANGDDIFYVTDIDIEVNSSTIWNFDCSLNTVPALSFDFYSVMLHELGHAHMLRHALPLPKLMYPAGDPGEKMGFADEDIDGGLDVMAYSEDNLTGDCPEPNDPLLPEGCVNGTKDFRVDDAKKIKVSPNPFNNLLLIETEVVGFNPIEVKVFDSLGREIIRKTVVGQTSFELDMSNANLSGLYFLHIQTDTDSFSTTLVKIQ